MILQCRTGAVWAAILLLGVAARSDVTVAPLFGDGMVLQRGQPVRIWGSAHAAESVEVIFAGQASTTTAAQDGRWLVTLPAQPASAESRELRVRGNNTLLFRDVVVGDVWICSGQSNMEFPVRDARDGAREMAVADQPLIRHVKIGRKLAEEPREDFTATPWRRAEPEHVGNFTAVGYFFAREMVQATGVPVGLVNCSWSGTPVEPWMSAKTLTEKAQFSVVGERWRADLAAYPERRRAYDQVILEWEKAEAAAKSAGAEAHV